MTSFAFLEMEGVGLEIDVFLAFVAFPVAAHPHMCIYLHLSDQEIAALALDFLLSACKKKMLFKGFSEFMLTVFADLMLLFYVV